MVGKKLVIIDVDSLLGIRNTLHYPCCTRDTCNKDGDFLGDNHRCLRRKWCESASYDIGGIQQYRSELNIALENCYMAVIPALKKLAKLDWLVSFWTTRPENQTFRIIRTLKDAGIWDTAQKTVGTPLLLNSSKLTNGGAYSPATEKLALFERVYGKLSDSGYWLAAIEADPLEASILQAYTGSRTTVHTSPKIWIQILMLEREGIDGLLWGGSLGSGEILTNLAS